MHLEVPCGCIGQDLCMHSGADEQTHQPHSIQPPSSGGHICANYINNFTLMLFLQGRLISGQETTQGPEYGLKPC